MMRRIKNTFLPNESNDYVPHIMKEWGILSLVVLILIVFIIGQSPVFYFSADQAAVLPTVLVDLTNADRQTNGLGGLTLNPTLVASAQAKANDMAKNGYFAHISPEGRDPWFWFSQVGYSYRSAGENLAVGFFESRDVVDAWMESLTHRANILSEKYTEIGVAVARGTYNGLEVVFAVQHFGRPLVGDEQPIMVMATEEIDTNEIIEKDNTELATEVLASASDEEEAGIALSDEEGRAIIVAMVSRKIDSETFVEIEVEEDDSVVYAPASNNQSYADTAQNLLAQPSSLVGIVYLAVGLMLILISPSLWLILGLIFSKQKYDMKVAKLSLSQISSHQSIVTRLPNHIWASSCAIVLSRRVS